MSLPQHWQIGDSDPDAQKIWQISSHDRHTTQRKIIFCIFANSSLNFQYKSSDNRHHDSKSIPQNDIISRPPCIKLFIRRKWEAVVCAGSFILAVINLASIRIRSTLQTKETSQREENERPLNQNLNLSPLRPPPPSLNQNNPE
ncbi:hypothetical protein ACJJTC_003011 [Scirpophaga incertulas]